MFRETDETITEPQFINLSYVQAQHDYLQVWLAERAQLGSSHPDRCTNPIPRASLWGQRSRRYDV